MSKDDIVFKGTKEGLYIILKEEADFDEIKEQLDRKLMPSKNFFEGAKIINFKGKKISEEEYLVLKGLLESHYGMKVIGDYKTLGNNINEKEEKAARNGKVEEQSCGQEEKGLFVRGTIRSGQLIRHGSNIIIIGDVNPGAHIEATGSVLVMGIMRGTAHAGSQGNYNSYIAAFRLEPMQLRIGDIITRSPDGIQYKSKVPEIAVVRRGMIVVEPY